MADRYLRLTGTAPGRFVTRHLGLPQPRALRRWSQQTPDLPGPVLRLTAGDTPTPGTYGGVVLDATAVADPADLQDVHAALHPLARSLTPCGRIVVLGSLPQDGGLAHAAAQQALEGFVRSLGKEVGRGSTVQLVRLAPGAAADSTLDFLLSPRSAYVSGQDLARVRETAMSLRAGQVSINGASDRSAPFGGYKMSGNGREWGDYAFHEYLEIKALIGWGAEAVE